MRPAEAEGEVTVRRSPHVQPVRVGELGVVVVRPGVPDRHLVALLDAAAVHDDVPGRSAAEVVHGVRAPQELVRGGPGERRVGDQPLQLLGVREKVVEAERDRVARRLVARRREQDEHDAELLLGEPRAVDLGLDQLRRDVLARFPSPLLAELPSVLDQVERERARERELAELGVLERDLGDVLGTDDLGVGVAEDLVAELDDQLPVLDRQAHDVREDPHRDLLGDRVDPVELVLGECAAEDVPRQPADALLVGVHDARREALVDERAEPRVRGRVGVDHRPSRLELLRRQVLQRRAAELGRERLPVLRHREDVVVARQRPEPASVLLRLPVQRRVPAQQREPVVRDPLLPDVEVGEIDVVEDEIIERGAGHRRLARGGLGDVVVACVHRRLGERRRPEADEQRASLLARLVDRERVERGRREDVSRAHVELRAVARADDHAAVELAVGERALLVRAGVVERHPARRRPADAHRAAVRLDAPEVTLRRVVGTPDVVPLDGRHPCGSYPSVSSRGATPWCSAAWAAALATFSRRRRRTRTNQTSATAISPMRPVGGDPVVVRRVVRVGVEGAVEAEDRRRDRDRDDEVLPPPLREPERRDREDEVDELDRERPDRRREDERRELVVREERHELPIRAGGPELRGVVGGLDEEDQPDAPHDDHQIADPGRVVPRGLREHARQEAVATEREEAAPDEDTDRERECHCVEDNHELEERRVPLADVLRWPSR